MKIKILSVLIMLALLIGFFIYKKVDGNNKVSMSVEPGAKCLVAYFSRSGDQLGDPNIKEGNTYIIAKMIEQKTGADIFEIKVKNDNYPKGEELSKYVQNEKQKGVRPELAGHIDNFDKYSTVFVGYPIWMGDMPMPVYSFLEQYDFSGKNIIPFCTHGGSGLSNTPQTIKSITKAKSVDSGFDILGNIAQNKRQDAEKAVDNWLSKLEF